MKTHEFTLILSGVAKITPELADALYTATGGDIELNCATASRSWNSPGRRRRSAMP
ncbi:MAG: hypothetical protein WD069_05540 [Planctomycetales bacterium]